MPPSTAIHQYAQRAVQLVPGLLDVHLHTAEVETDAVVAVTIERVADHLIRWHDELCGVRPVAVTGAAEAGEAVPGTAGPARASVELAEAVRAGRPPGSAASVQLAAGTLTRVARQVSSIVSQVPAAHRPHGELIRDEVGSLADLLADHAARMRDLGARVGRVRQRHPELSHPAARAELDQLLARVVRAEHRVRRTAAATLPA